jgi:hypothetical protein
MLPDGNPDEGRVWAAAVGGDCTALDGTVTVTVPAATSPSGVSDVTPITEGDHPAR